ncbi:hypothetical protein ACFX2I_015597 [Malus domestica]
MRFVQRGLGGGQAPESSEAIEAKKMKMKKKKEEEEEEVVVFNDLLYLFLAPKNRVFYPRGLRLLGFPWVTVVVTTGDQDF